MNIRSAKTGKEVREVVVEPLPKEPKRLPATPERRENAPKRRKREKVPA